MQPLRQTNPTIATQEAKEYLVSAMTDLKMNVEVGNPGKGVQADAKAYVLSVMGDRVAKIDPDTCEERDIEPFFVADLGEVYRQQQRWKLNLPRVKPHYGESKSPMTKHCRLTFASCEV